MKFWDNVKGWQKLVLMLVVLGATIFHQPTADRIMVIWHGTIQAVKDFGGNP